MSRFVFSTIRFVLIVTPGSTILLFLAFIAQYLDEGFWTRLTALLTAICLARFTSRIMFPVSAIIVKWVVIGRYKPGTYRM